MGCCSKIGLSFYFDEKMKLKREKFASFFYLRAGINMVQYAEHKGGTIIIMIAQKRSGKRHAPYPQSRLTRRRVIEKFGGCSPVWADTIYRFKYAGNCKTDDR